MLPLRSFVYPHQFAEHGVHLDAAQCCVVVTICSRSRSQRRRNYATVVATLLSTTVEMVASLALGLRPIALDLLSIPTMSCDLKRVFTDTKRLIAPRMNRMSDETIEKRECLS